MKKKGFTLIELLAVIVILAIIALIATPLVLKYIESAREKAFYNSIEGVKKAADLKVVSDKLNGDFKGTKVYTINDLDLKNKNNLSGKVIAYKQEGGYAIILINVTDGKYTYSGTDSKDIIGNSDKWVVSPTFSDRILQYKPLGDEEYLIYVMGDYALTAMYYYMYNEEYSNSKYFGGLWYNRDFIIGKDIDDTMKKYDEAMSDYFEFVPKYVKEERVIFINKLKEKFGSTVTSNIEEELVFDFVEEIKDDIPLIYQLFEMEFIGTSNIKYDLDLIRDTNNVVTVIPNKVNGIDIKRISKCSFDGTTDADLATESACYAYRTFENPIFDLYISEGIESIGSSYFNSSFVLSVSLPSTVKEIENNAFANNQIKKLVLPEGIESLGINAFGSNEITGTLVIPSTLNSISSGAFKDNKIEKVILNEGFKQTGKNMFMNNNIKEVKLPSTLQTIQNNTFRNNQIEEIVIPASVETIGKYAFLGNPLTKITIEGDKTRFNDSWLDIGFPEDLMPN